MRCSICARDNPDDARFCNACGAPLHTVSEDRLRALRAFIPADTAQKILQAGGLGERRTVTVLFSDVVGSTALGERLGPERFKVVMDQLLGRMINAVARYEGTVAQVMGDGLLAFFGAPLAHEDDPERAVRAALDLRDAVSAYSRDLEAAYGLSLQVRIGLNSGPIVLSQVTDILQVAYNALGDTVTTAARLQSAATPGGVLASDDLTRQVGPLFDMRPLGPLALKGKERPVAATQILAPRLVKGKIRGIEGLAAPLVGRDTELARLAEIARDAAEGLGHIVAIIGEAGIGKSRLVEEARRAVTAVRWFEGRCLSYAGAIAYFPFQDLMREWLGVTAADHEAKVRIELQANLQRLFGPRAGEVYPYVGAMLRLPLEPDAAVRIADLSAESLQHQTFKFIREWATRLAEERPLGLIFDDIHWADTTTLALLEALLESTERAPLLLCLLFRPERTHGCWRLNDRARERFPHRHAELTLQPLRPDDAQHLIGSLLTLADFPTDVRDLILEKAEGNPFFVEEVIRELIEAGALVREGDRWRAARPVTTLDIPDSVQGVLLSRIDRLPHEAKRVLQAAAVIGRLFPLATLRQALGENGRVDAALLDLQRHELIIERRRIPQAEYRFKHALTQEVAYSTLVQAERHRLHRVVAEALEEQYTGRLDEVYGLLAYHWDQSREEERALHFLVRAGDKSRAEYAGEEAIRHYARAVELMKHRGEWEAAADTLMKMALAHHIAFNFRAANATYQEAFEILEVRRPQAPTPRPPATLRWAMLQPAVVDSARHSDAPSGFLMSQVFEGLLQHGPEANVQPALARVWEISDDGTRYRFHLHRNRRWSDGRPVTAHDFVFTWLRGMRGRAFYMFHDIVGAKRYYEGKTDDPAAVGVRALDDHTLEVMLEGPRSYFPFILGHPATAPHPRWAIERYGDEWTSPDHLVCNGPFLIAEWQRDSHIRLVANHQYTGPRRGNVQQAYLIFKDFHDPALFEEGRVDVQLFPALEPDHIERLRHAVDAAPIGRVAYFFFRCDRPPFDDRRLRLAFAHALDRQAVGRKGRAGAVPADGGLVPPSIPGHSPHVGVPFDPERARRLLAEAGFPGGRGLGPFTVPMLEGAEPRLYEAAAQAWQDILGVQVAIERMPAPDYWPLLDDPPPLARSAWIADHPDPENFLRVLFHSTSGWNSPRWKNEKFDRLIEEAQASANHRQRMALYHEADHLLVEEEAVVIPIVYTRVMSLIQPYVGGWWSSILAQCPIADLIVDRPTAEPEP